MNKLKIILIFFLIFIPSCRVSYTVKIIYKRTVIKGNNFVDSIVVIDRIDTLRIDTVD